MNQIIERFQKQRAEREASQRKVDEAMCADCLGAGLRLQAYNYAWDERHSSGLHEVEDMYEDLLALMIRAHDEGMSIVLGGP
ncbi:hypothetical protein [Sulfitobacter faviae]|uniref:hypothetical protein n=1 Tax=Sulfitobacter faviae TaxID=1775881 RepID=UPI00398D6162